MTLTVSDPLTLTRKTERFLSSGECSTLRAESAFELFRTCTRLPIPEAMPVSR